MSIETTRNFFMWCSVINDAVLLFWAVLILLCRNELYRLWGRWFRLPPERFDALNFGGMTIDKTGIILFNIVPWIALHLVK